MMILNHDGLYPQIQSRMCLVYRVLTMQTVLLNLFQLIVETLLIRDQPPQPLLGVLQTRETTEQVYLKCWFTIILL